MRPSLSVGSSPNQGTRLACEVSILSIISMTSRNEEHRQKGCVARIQTGVSDRPIDSRVNVFGSTGHVANVFAGYTKHGTMFGTHARLGDIMHDGLPKQRRDADISDIYVDIKASPQKEQPTHPPCKKWKYQR